MKFAPLFSAFCCARETSFPINSSVSGRKGFGKYPSVMDWFPLIAATRTNIKVELKRKEEWIGLGLLFERKKGKG